MTLDPEISKQVHAAFNSRDAEEFHRLLSEHPEFLRHADGTDWWMWKAAQRGELMMLKTLVSLGQNVNEPTDVEDPDNPFCQVEGPILQAATEGHLEIVEWLLAQGAQINFEFAGQRRCLPLLDAATNGHLDVVKLLVSHGADIHAKFNGHTALSQAINYGHPEVADYLRSVGAK